MLKRSAFRWFACLIFTALTSSVWAAATSTTQIMNSQTPGWAERAPAAEILEKIRADERWLWKARTVQMEAESQWIMNPESLKLRAAQPKSNSRVARSTDTPAEIQCKDFWAWDGRRIATVSERSGQFTQRQVFAGGQFYSNFINAKSRREQYGIDTTATQHFGGWTLAALMTGRIAYPDTWWIRMDATAQPAVYEPVAAKIKDLGIKVREGRRYRVLRLFMGLSDTRDCWIDVQSGRLAIYQSLHYFGSKVNNPDTAEARDNAIFDKYLEKLIGDPELRGRVQAGVAEQRRKDPRWIRQYNAITYRKPPKYNPDTSIRQLEIDVLTVRLDAMKELGLLGAEAEPIRVAMLNRIASGETPWQDVAGEVTADDESPWVEYRLSDWRDVGGGRLFPFRQDQSVWSTMSEDNGLKESDRVVRVTRLELDQPLPEELFKMELKEGVDVFDQRHLPPLSYRYKKQFSGEEWDKILAQTETMNFIDKGVLAAQKAMVGSEAPELKIERWVSGGPLSIKALKEKYVALHFFSERSQQGADDTAKMVEYEKQWRKKGVTVIGIYTAHATVEEVRKFMKEKGVTWPVAVDAPREGTYGFGQTFGEYKVIGVPHTVLIDGSGMILAHDKGWQVDEVLKKLIP